jgi:hypothetical protein
VKENAIRSEGGKGSPVKILLTDTDRRAYAARVAMAFAECGCQVSIVCTDHHPIENIKAPHRIYPYSALRPLNSLWSAIESAVPDLILPCDDRAVQHLQQLSGQFHSDEERQHRVACLIERSLGPPASYPIISSRYPLLQLAQAEGIRIPATSLLHTPEDLSNWRAKQPFPWVLKADGTWGGYGVRITDSLPDAQSKFNVLGTPCRLRRAFKRALVNRDYFYFRAWWKAFSPAVIAQAFVRGRPANCAVACSKGKVLAQANVEVLAASTSTGPAIVVRRVDNPEMVRAAERIASRLQLSGLFGLDFVIETGSGATYLIEMNPRCTPLCHIQLGSGPDLLAALYAHLAGRPLPKRPAPVAQNANEVIAYYPHTWNFNGDSQRAVLQDFPHGEPELATALLRPFPSGTLLCRVADYFSETPVPQGYESGSAMTAGLRL